jgi:peptide/nickel transport system ATP-binding protein/oligopeptide transport system ATP-binding protein
MKSSSNGAGAAARTTPAPLLEVEHVKLHFPIKQGILFTHQVGAVHAVDDISFTLVEGETLGLVGESGCGKTTLSRTIMRLLEPTGGAVRFRGDDVTHSSRKQLLPLRREMQMVFQDPYASLNPRKRIGQIVGMALERSGQEERHVERHVQELLERVGLAPEHVNRFPHEFSGGQRQRIGVARALAVSPKLIVLDEPVSALDVSIQAQIINLLEDLQDDLGLTYLFVAHDLSVVAHISDRIAVMYLGRIVELTSSRELNRHPLHPYTVALLSAIPIPDPVVEARRRRIILRGDVPSPVNPPSGCRFHTRCWLRERLGNPESCVTIDPPLTEIAPGHEVACHFADQVDGSAEQVLATGRRPSTAPAPPPAVGAAEPAVPPTGPERTLEAPGAGPASA